MAAEGAIIGGLATIAALLGYFSIQFYHIGGELEKKISLALSMFSFLFMALIMFFVHAIAVSQAVYLSTKLTVIGVKIMLWFTMLVVSYISIYIIFSVVRGLIYFCLEIFGKEKRKVNEDE